MSLLSHLPKTFKNTRFARKLRLRASPYCNTPAQVPLFQLRNYSSDAGATETEADQTKPHFTPNQFKISDKYEEILKKLPIAFHQLNLDLKSSQFTHAQKRLEQIRQGLYENVQQEDASVPKSTSESFVVMNTGKKLDASILAYQIALTAKQEDAQGNKRFYSILMLERIEKDSFEKVQQDRDHVDFMLQLIAVFEEVEELDLAIRLYKWLIDNHQKYNVVYYCRVGELYERKKQLKMAEQYYRECVEINKNFGQAYHRLSNVYEMKGHVAPALEYFAKYASFVFEKEDQVQEDEYIHVGCKLGHLLSVNRNFDTADDYFQRLFSKYSNRIDILYEWIISLSRQRLEGRDTREMLELAGRAVEQTIVASDAVGMEMYRALSRLHLALEANAPLLDTVPEESEMTEEQLKSTLPIEKSWKFIEQAWEKALTKHDKQLVLWEAIKLNPTQEKYQDRILAFFASSDELYTENEAFWNRISRLMYPEPHEFTDENENLKKNSYDVELFLVDKPVALVTVLAADTEQATQIALQFGRHVHPDANITNLQYPSLFYKPHKGDESDWYGIKNVHTSAM